MKQKRILSPIRHFQILAVSYFSLEILFRLLMNFDLFNVQMLRILMFTLTLSGLLVLVTMPLKPKAAIILNGVVLFGACLLGFSQVSYRNYMGNFFSVRLIGMFNEVASYSVDFISYLRPVYFICFLPFLAYLYMIRRNRDRIALFSWKETLTGSMLLMTLHLLSLLSLGWWVNEIAIVLPKEIYYEPVFSEPALRELGVERFFIRDVVYALSYNVNDVEIPDSDSSNIPDDPQDVDDRVFDDTLWIKRMNQETDEKIKEIDRYLLSRDISGKNEMSGVLKGKNVVYVLVEAMDWLAIDEVLTPTLYRLTQEGLLFDHYYVPQYSCNTAESEFISLTSLLPHPGSCTQVKFTDNTYSQSILNLFKDAGYYTTSYHNFSDKFYPRSTTHINLGSQKYYNDDDLNITALDGWPSDVELMEEALAHFIDEDKFFSYIITSSMHLPYDVDSTLGNRYLEEVQARYPDAPITIQRYKSKAMEFDRSVKALIQGLEEAGKLEDTVLVLYPDHFPLKTEIDEIISNTTQVDRSYGMDLYRSMMIIYNPLLEGRTISTVASTFDLLPTVTNLLGIKSDPRLYFGQDIFDPEADHLVYFANGNWVHPLGYYSAAEGDFFPRDPQNTLSFDEIIAFNQKVKDYFDVSHQILISDYFSKR